VPWRVCVCVYVCVVVCECVHAWLAVCAHEACGQGRDQRFLKQSNCRAHCFFFAIAARLSPGDVARHSWISACQPGPGSGPASPSNSGVPGVGAERRVTHAHVRDAADTPCAQPQHGVMLSAVRAILTRPQAIQTCAHTHPKQRAHLAWLGARCQQRCSSCGAARGS
jgi:hypothetical protein